MWFTKEKKESPEITGLKVEIKLYRDEIAKLKEMERNYKQLLHTFSNGEANRNFDVTCNQVTELYSSLSDNAKRVLLKRLKVMLSSLELRYKNEKTK